MGDAIAKMTETHHQMVLWLVENPGKTLAEMSRHFGYSSSWLSQVINSSLFQARLQELQAAEAGSVIADIPAKLRGLTCLAVDGLTEAVDDAMKDPSKMLHRTFLRETAELGLKSLGFAPKPTVAGGSPFIAQTNNYVTVHPEVLAAARGKLLEHNNALSNSAQLPASLISQGSVVQQEPATVLESARPQGQIPSGGAV